MLPGVPEIFELKFTDLRKRLDQGQEFHSHAVFTLSGEGEIASLLEQIAKAFPGVMVGSYVKWKAEDYRTKVTFDGNDLESVTNAADMLIRSLPPNMVVRRE